MRASCHKCSFYKCCRMERNSVEFLEGEIFIISQAPCRLAVISRAFLCLKEGESFENLYNLCPTTVQRRETIPETFFGRMFQLLFHKKLPSLLSLINIYLEWKPSVVSFCGNQHGVWWKENWIGTGTSSPDSTGEFPSLCCCFGHIILR